MRADRLLQIMLLLQAHGRLHAGELAARLEVSVRTIQRDMDALSGAGVPVYAQRGRDGGWALVDGFRSTLTGLTPSEALAVAVGRADTVLSDLGLGGGEAALLKVLAATPPLAREIAEHARQRVHVDLEPWGNDERNDALRPLHAAADTDRIVTLHYRADPELRRVAPLGLVLKGSVWYLVGKAGRAVRTYRVSRISDVTITDETFSRPAGFDLATHWKRARAEFVGAFGSYPTHLRARGLSTRRLSWLGAKPRAVSLDAVDESDWVDFDADLENIDEAASAVLASGPDVVVVAPAELRRRVVQLSAAIHSHNAGTSAKDSMV